MGNNQQIQTQEPNIHLNHLLKNQPTLASFIQGQQIVSDFTIKCPQCNLSQFDDGLGRTIQCPQCKLGYSVNDGNASVNNTRAIKLNPPQQIASLVSMVLYVNINTIPNELRANGKIDFPILQKNVVIPFFSIRQRIVSTGSTFKIGMFEFKCIGAQPHQGVVNSITEIYLYNTFSSDPIRKVEIYSEKIIPNVENELANLVDPIIKHENIHIANQNILILNCDKDSGKLTQQTRIKQVSHINRLKKVKLICQKMPIDYSQLPQRTQDSKYAILRTVVVPYFTAMTRYLEREQIIKINDFEFFVNLEEENGIVIPFQTSMEVEIGVIRETQIITTTHRIRRQHLQRDESRIEQIEALHRLLNIFILMQSNQISAGASEGEIRNLPTSNINLEFLKSKQFDEDRMNCKICLTEYFDKEEIRTMPCLHYFHQQCIDQWLDKSRVCPICRTDVNSGNN
ncbi:hypothetical protein pb186bvf_016142 [Paramecium bursaria]